MEPGSACVPEDGSVPVERPKWTLETTPLSRIVGERWFSEPWRYARKYLLREDEAAEEAEMALLADGIRRKATQALGRFYATLRGSRTGEVTASVVSEAVLALLADLDVRAKIEEWRKLAEAAGDLAEPAITRASMPRWRGPPAVARSCETSPPTQNLLAAVGADGGHPAGEPSLRPWTSAVGDFRPVRGSRVQVTFLNGAQLGVSRAKPRKAFSRQREGLPAADGVEIKPASYKRQFTSIPQYMP